VKPWGVHEMENEEWLEDVKIEPYHTSFLANLTESAIRSRNWVRTNIEGIVVKVQETSLED
jgi:hypothetical protein